MKAIATIGTCSHTQIMTIKKGNANTFKKAEKKPHKKTSSQVQNYLNMSSVSNTSESISFKSEKYQNNSLPQWGLQ